MIKFEKVAEPETLGECEVHDIVKVGVFTGIVGPKASVNGSSDGRYGRWITWRDGTGSVHPLGTPVKRIGRLVWE